jgi:prepilin-type N-terminal cleavage/methylation domain-containing protein
VDQLKPVEVRRRAARAGFTLIEIMIAMALVGFGLLALAAMQLQALRFGSSGKHVSQAALFAREKMEEFQRLPWSDVAVTTGWTAPVTKQGKVESESGTVNEQDYGLSWQITDLITNRTRSIDVQVIWDEPGRPGRTYTLSSVRNNGGV